MKTCSGIQKNLGGFFCMFSSILNNTFNDFKTLWWKMAIVNLSMFFMFVLGACLSLVFFIALLGLNQVMGDVSGATTSGFLNIKSIGLLFIAFLVGLGSVFTWGTKVMRNASVIILGIIAIGIFLYISLFGDFEGGAAVLESFIANWLYGGFLTPLQWGSFMIALLSLITWVFTWGMVAKIANYQLTKSVIAKESKNPLKIFLVDSWGFFWRFISLSVKVFLYIFGPVFLWMFIGLIGLLLLAFSQVQQTPELIMILNVVSIIFMIVFFLILINRSVKMIFSQISLIEEDGNSKEAKAQSQELVTKNFWKVLFSLIIVMGFYFFFVALLKIPQNFNIEVSTITLKVLFLFDIILSFIIFPPIMFSFTYRLMNFLKSQKEK